MENMLRISKAIYREKIDIESSSTMLTPLSRTFIVIPFHKLSSTKFFQWR